MENKLIFCQVLNVPNLIHFEIQDACMVQNRLDYCLIIFICKILKVFRVEKLKDINL